MKPLHEIKTTAMSKFLSFFFSPYRSHFGLGFADISCGPSFLAPVCLSYCPFFLCPNSTLNRVLLQVNFQLFLILCCPVFLRMIGLCFWLWFCLQYKSAGNQQTLKLPILFLIYKSPVLMQRSRGNWWDNISKYWSLFHMFFFKVTINS